MQMGKGGRHATETYGMGSFLPPACQPFDEMAARENLSDFGKVKMVCDAHNIGNLTVALVCRKVLVC